MTFGKVKKGINSHSGILRGEKLEQWLATARRVGTCEKTRPGKNVFRGFVAHKKPVGMEEVPMFIAFEVTERLTDAKTGESFLIPELEVSTWRTNHQSSVKVAN